ncbi:zinc finger, GRF-type [Artemisia annua]|uniref:Zinc finger, GRF-type n=1 Tax=Artemisia annua TaxID=35608 RepID=A0A2U1NAF6_ARTAN|nr:zinc finger, GRF-type [Artemisia annua]
MVVCTCSQQPVAKTSWTDRNPGCRFYGYPTYVSLDSNSPFLGWVDAPMCPRTLRFDYKVLTSLWWYWVVEHGDPFYHKLSLTEISQTLAENGRVLEGNLFPFSIPAIVGVQLLDDACLWSFMIYGSLVFLHRFSLDP